MLSFTLDGYEGAGMVGKIHYRRFFKTMHIPARPSDGIALAVRMKAPIYLSDDILSSYFFIPGKEKQHLNEYRDVLYL
jgi:bifunctional DNase/RNase